jgi:long-chain acyl-CoA synthetase
VSGLSLVNNLINAVSQGAGDSELVAMIANGERTTYAELFGLCGSLQEQLVRAGVRRGQCVCVCSGSKRDFIIGLLAAWMADAVPVPLPEDEPEHAGDLVNSVAPAAIIGPEVALARIATDSDAVLLPTFGHGLRAPHLRDGSESGDAIAVILHSSGTTTVQRKSAEISDKALHRIVSDLNAAVSIAPGITEYLMSSPSHAFGFARVCAVFVRLGTLVIDDGTFNPLRVLSALRKYGCGSLTGVASGFTLLIEKFPEHLGEYGRSLRWIEIGSNPMLLSHKRDMLSLLPDVQPVMEYGMTESMRSTFVNYRLQPEKLDSVGCPAPGVEVTVIDSGGAVLPPGTQGEIAVRGTHLARGYWRQPEVWKSRIANGWFRSGDWGWMDSDGFVHFVARHDDIINSGGYKISPDEVESLLAEVLPNCRYAVVGRPDPILGEIPVVCIEGKSLPSCEFDLREAIAARLPPWKQPREFRLFETLPRTSNGKLQRRKLKEWLQEPPRDPSFET